MSTAGDPFTPSPEIAAIARRWLITYAGRNADAVVKLFSCSGAVSYIGSDDGEFFEGAETRRMFGAFTNHQVVLELEDMQAKGFESGSVAWAYVHTTVHSPEAGMRVRFRTTMVLSLEDAVWRVVHVHNSNPKPNMESMGYQSPNLEALAAAAQSNEITLGHTGIASVMFTDIVDSTALAAATGDARWSRIVTDHVAAITAQVTAGGGTLVKSLGDGTLSTFGSAATAMTAARAIMQATADSTAEPRLRLRVGIHTGDVVEAQGDFLGSVVNKAARVAAAAAPDEIRVSDATRAMIGSSADFSFADAVSVPLKGLDGEHILFRLDWQT
ncbi:adenylate/guanylate cyclase domain-containing protein [uncultured Tateyamaria sp.]|uniref:adenylate/guanylate cyclase domain-containing protein n=1 Tax=uncultured Tateyamaria sp. TaxID=455651 RepID=UPI0026023592|nr:adenylate/guanylate cyclase domain-containing protein [uncultured Tateyamaria sp.]